MVLGFKPQFVEKILSGQKIHTIRQSGAMWKPGMLIHFATGVRTRRYKQFHSGQCELKQAVALNPEKREIHLGLNGKMNLLNKEHNALFAKNDGFDSEEDFWEWFNEPFYGFVIHWTDFIYS